MSECKHPRKTLYRDDGSISGEYCEKCDAFWLRRIEPKQPGWSGNARDLYVEQLEALLRRAGIEIDSLGLKDEHGRDEALREEIRKAVGEEPKP